MALIKAPHHSIGQLTSTPLYSHAQKVPTNLPAQGVETGLHSFGVLGKACTAHPNRWISWPKLPELSYLPSKRGLSLQIRALCEGLPLVTPKQVWRTVVESLSQGLYSALMCEPTLLSKFGGKRYPKTCWTCSGRQFSARSRSPFQLVLNWTRIQRH